MIAPDNYKSRAQWELEIYMEVAILWQIGDWKALSEYDIKTLECHSRAKELQAMCASAYLQLGHVEQARQVLAAFNQDQTTQKILLSGVHNSLGKARALQRQRRLALRHFSDALALGKVGQASMEQARTAEQYAHLGLFQYWKGSGAVDRQGQHKRLFIDCGGYDGCSVIKFLLANPGYDVITFEANPELWPYYEKLPTTLIKKAVYNYDGVTEFTLDPIDADGSSLIKEKKIDFNQKIKNEDCPVLEVECINLSSFVAEKATEYEHIELKLDVEGAEYAILETMLKEGTLKYINKLYAEFHWNKISLDKEQHDYVLGKVTAFVKVEGWDAHEFGVYKRDHTAIKRRVFFESIL